MSALMAAHAASLTEAGAGKSGNPCDRLTPPWASLSRVISRMTDSVNCSAFLEPMSFDIRVISGGPAPLANWLGHGGFLFCARRRFHIGGGRGRTHVRRNLVVGDDAGRRTVKPAIVLG